VPISDNTRLARRDDTLLAQIERDVLDDATPLSSALRKCVILGGKAGSEPLRDWATRELHGYDGEDPLPDYRVIAAPLMVDGVVGHVQITHQQFPPSGLPEFVREHISEQVKLRDGVGGIEALARQPEIRLCPPRASDLARYMNASGGRPDQHIISLYWAVSPATVQGVLDRIRTALTQLVAELRANMAGAEEEIPSTEAANQALNVVVTGRRSRVSVTAAQASGSSTATTSPGQEPPGRFWTRWRKLGAFAAGLATVVAAVVAVAQAL
jgi:hypothetical protein